MSLDISLDSYIARVAQIDPVPASGRVVRTVGLLVESSGPHVSVGSMCEVVGSDGRRVPVQVVGFRDGTVLSVPLGDTVGVRPGDRVVGRPDGLSVGVGRALLGRVVDALGRPMDEGGPIPIEESYPLHPAPMNPMSRDPIVAHLGTGVRAIDGLLTCGAASVSASSAGRASARARSSG